MNVNNVNRNNINNNNFNRNNVNGNNVNRNNVNGNNVNRNNMNANNRANNLGYSEPKFSQKDNAARYQGDSLGQNQRNQGGNRGQQPNFNQNRQNPGQNRQNAGAPKPWPAAEQCCSRIRPAGSERRRQERLQQLWPGRKHAHQ